MKNHTQNPEEQLEDQSTGESQVLEDTLDDEVAELQLKLVEAEQKYQRAIADYHNLVRRNREEAVKKARLATKDFVSNLVETLNHLALAAQQINDPGLNMVVTQLWQTLNQEGLEQVECLGTPFDAETMEVVEITKVGKKVTKVLSPCYRLNGEIIQFAKVILD